MSLIKNILNKDFASLKDYTEERIASIVAGKIISKKDEFLSKVRGLGENTSKRFYAEYNGKKITVFADDVTEARHIAVQKFEVSPANVGKLKVSQNMSEEDDESDEDNEKEEKMKSKDKEPDGGESEEDMDDDGDEKKEPEEKKEKKFPFKKK